MKTILFTKQGFKNIEQEYELLKVKRKDAVEQLKKSRDMGDLSENGYYKAAKFELSSIDRRVRTVLMFIQNGKVTVPLHLQAVDIGHTVRIADDVQEYTYRIVGDFEAKPQEGMISYVSPLGTALMGKKTGEIVTLMAPQGKISYTVIAIDYTR